MTTENNLTPDQAFGARPMARPNVARSREEVRRQSSGFSRSETVNQIKQRLQDGSPAPQPSTEGGAPEEQPKVRTPEPEAEKKEAAPSEAPATETDSGDGGEVEEDLIEYLDDFASSLELEPDQIRGLKSKVKVNGEEVEVSLADALSSYQFAKANTEERQKLRAQEREFNTLHEERMQSVQKTIEESKAYHVAAAHVLSQDLQRPEIAALKEQDPGAYLQWMDLVNQRHAALQQSYQQLVQREAQIQSEAFEQRRKAALNRLHDAIPDVDTEERRAKIFKVLEAGGVPREEAVGITDDRILVFASKFADMQERIAQYEAREAQAKKQLKQVVDKPKAGVRKPRQSKSGVNRKAIDAAKDSVRGQTGRRGVLAKAQAINAILQNSRKR